MGQQQTAVAGSALRRMILVLVVAALVAVLSIATAMPAMADSTKDGNQGPPTQTGDFDNPHGSIVAHTDNGPSINHFGGGKSNDQDGNPAGRRV